MKAFIIKGKHQSSLIDVDLEAPEDEEIVVAVKTLGLCGSDLKTFNDENPMVSFRIIPGHEIGCE
ncbi:MAG: alcohol dehydrogenase catalytic domain-containing protein, partial [Candidatus Heimdallarchaeaceae archaeon]